MIPEHANRVRLSCPRCRLVFRNASFTCCPRDGTALVRASVDPLVGRTLAERYVIEECIGEGGMGLVYRAHHKLIGRYFAIKVLFGDWTANQTVVSRFIREASAAGRVNHRNLVPVVDFGEAEDGLLYLAMEYVDGENLNRVIEREGPLERERVIRLMIQLCHGLAHAHGKGLVHRDFKTDNILVGHDEEGEFARITDFGIAMMAEADSTNRLTTQGAVVGTPAYMSPEQATGDPMDHRTDLFSLGLVMYEMMAGVLPFTGSPMCILRCNLVVPPPPIAERVPGLQVDPELEALAIQLMAKDPDDRPSDAHGVGLRLEALLVDMTLATHSFQRHELAAPADIRRCTPVHPSATRTTLTLPEQPNLLADRAEDRTSPSPRRAPVWFALGATAAAVVVYVLAVFLPNQESRRSDPTAAAHMILVETDDGEEPITTTALIECYITVGRALGNLYETVVLVPTTWTPLKTAEFHPGGS